MSNEVQLSPAASNSPTVTLPSSAPAGHVTDARACRSRWLRWGDTTARDVATSQKSGSSGHLSRPYMDSRPQPAGRATGRHQPTPDDVPPMYLALTSRRAAP